MGIDGPNEINVCFTLLENDFNGKISALCNYFAEEIFGLRIEVKLLCNENEKVKTHQDKGKLTSLNWKLNS